MPLDLASCARARPRHRTLVRLAVGVLVGLVAQPVWARPMWRQAFNDLYPATRGTVLDGPDRSVCGVCHRTAYGFDIGGERNPYGNDFLRRFSRHGGPCPDGDSACAIALLDALDSDGDGTSNADEIQGLTWPGYSNEDCPPEAGWRCQPVPFPSEDLDGDGFSPSQGDCNDEDPSVYAGAPDACGDERDQDCDGADTECESTAEGVEVPAGFEVSLFATGLELPTSMDVGPDGRLYVAEHVGRIRAIDGSGGLPATVQTFAEDLYQPFGLAWGPDGKLYVSQQDGVIERLTDPNLDGSADAVEPFVSGLCTICLPFSISGIDFDDAGNLYVGYVQADNPAYVNSILRITPAAVITEFATGIRNPTDIAVLPGGGLVGPDNGPETFDELNYIVEGADYGWPNFTGTVPPATGTESPVELYPKGRSPVGVVAYRGDDLCGYEGDLFQAFFHSSAFSDPLLRGRIQRVKIDDTGAPTVTLSETFAGRLNTPIDVAFDDTGNLYVDEYWTGNIYRISPIDANDDDIPDICQTEIFADGFEDGYAGSWSAEVP